MTWDELAAGHRPSWGELAAAYHVPIESPNVSGGRKSSQQLVLEALGHALPLVQKVIEQKRQDRIAEALMTGAAPRATAVTDAGGQVVSGGGAMSAAGVDQYNQNLGYPTSTDAFQGSPSERLQIADFISKQRADEQTARQKAIMDSLRQTKLQQDVSGTGPESANAPTYVNTPYGRMTAHQWSTHPANPDNQKADSVGKLSRDFKAETGASWGDWIAGDRKTEGDTYISTGGTPDAPKVLGRLPKDRAQYYIDRAQRIQESQPNGGAGNANVPDVTGPQALNSENLTSAQYPNGVNKTGGSRDVVTRVTKDGRKAIFDANTKEFIQYVQ